MTSSPAAPRSGGRRHPRRALRILGTLLFWGGLSAIGIVIVFPRAAAWVPKSSKPLTRTTNLFWGVSLGWLIAYAAREADSPGGVAGEESPWSKGEAASGKAGLAALGLTAALAFAAHSGAFGISFLLDDHLYLRWASQTSILEAAKRFAPASAEATNGRSFFRPLPELFWVIQYRLWGTRPVGYRLVSAALHACCAGLVQLLVAARGSRRAGLLAGALFALHPIHAESVVWLSGTTDLLCTLALLVSSLVLLRAGSSGSGRWLSAAAFGLALASKEIAILWPAATAMLILERPPSPQSLRKVLRVLWPQLLVAGCYLALRVRLFGGEGGYPAIRPWVQLERLAVTPLRPLAPLFFPLNASELAAAGAWLRVLVFLLLASTCLLFWRGGVQDKRGPRLALGALGLPYVLYWVAAIPQVAGPAPGPDLENMRLLYLPSVGFCWMLAVAILAAPPKVARAFALTFLCGLVLAGTIDRRCYFEADAIVADMRARVRAALGRDPTRRVAVGDLPLYWRGAPLIGDHLGSALLVLDGIPPGQVVLERLASPGELSDPKTVRLHWAAARARLE